MLSLPTSLITLAFANHLANPPSNPKCVLTHVWEVITHFHSSCLSCLFHVCPLHMRVKLTHTCVRSHASHTSCTPHRHVTIKGCSHMFEHIAPFELVKTLIHVESTWPLPHWSWEILALHLAFDLSRPLHLISYKRRALSSFPQALSTSLLCCWICEKPHPMSNEIIYTW